LWTSGPDGKCLGNDSRCRGSSELACNALSSDGADCKWRSAFIVTGNMTAAVSDADNNVSDADAKTAVIKGIANFTDVPPAYVDVDLAAETGKRRLRSQHLEAGLWTITYAIAVGGGAPESVATTGTEVAAKLKAENSDAISSSIEESLGGSASVSIKKMHTAKVIVKDSTASSTTQGDLESSARSMFSYFFIIAFMMVRLLMA